MPKALARNALKPYSILNRKRMLKKQLAKASGLTEASSLEVLREFEALKDPIFE